MQHSSRVKHEAHSTRGQPGVGADVAAEWGLDADDCRLALDFGRYTEMHQQVLRRARRPQITDVPAFLSRSQRLRACARLQD
ncbi:MAG: hypothetical protein M3332_10500 [Actinomycetota bacterium]|nr:hypothetical protein [Actinomycetota bacterium]